LASQKHVTHLHSQISSADEAIPPLTTNFRASTYECVMWHL